jgi:hypothetical protein
MFKIEMFRISSEIYKELKRRLEIKHRVGRIRESFHNTQTYFDARSSVTSNPVVIAVAEVTQVTSSTQRKTTNTDQTMPFLQKIHHLPRLRIVAQRLEKKKLAVQLAKGTSKYVCTMWTNCCY